jgi:hypothetical protein
VAVFGNSCQDVEAAMLADRARGDYRRVLGCWHVTI